MMGHSWGCTEGMQLAQWTDWGAMHVGDLMLLVEV